MNKVLGLVFAVVLVVFFTSSSVAAQQPTVEDNVLIVLRALHVETSIVVIERHKGYIVAKPAIKPDGTIDNRFWERIQTDRAKNKHSWFHDVSIFSKLWGNGKHSFRQSIRPSLQAVFYMKDGRIDRIKLDVDRFPPNWRAKISSVRHFLQEQIPNKLFGKVTDPVRMHNTLQKLYGSGVAVTKSQP